MAMTASKDPISGASIVRRLGSCNKTARDRAIRALSAWLPDQTSAAVSDADLAKIWKGLFYCVWHADKLPNQLDLANRLASLLLAVTDVPLASRYFEIFLLTIRREWGGIDFLRLDKFYLLIRRFLRHAFLFLKKHAWDRELTEWLIQTLSEKALLSADKHHANGVNYHLAEAFLDELKEFLPLGLENLELMLKPFLSVFEKSADKVLVNKVKVSIFDRFLDHGGKLLSLERAREQVEPGSDIERFGKFAPAMVLSKKFFQVASASDTLQANRKILFGLHESFLKLENDFEKSGIDISLEHFENGNLDKVMDSADSENTYLVGLTATNGILESDNKPARKRKKKSKKNSSDFVSDEKLSKKSKKSNSSSEGMEKQKRSKNNKELEMAPEQVNMNGISSNADPVNDVVTSNGDVAETDEMINFDECMISNLQKQFEKVAAEAGLESYTDGLNSLSATPVHKKKKKSKTKDRKDTENGNNSNEKSADLKSSEKSIKKVSFSMKNNLVWKPHNPMPPQSLRLPPSATPRGSALKKGVLPGPIRETPPTRKNIKAKSSSLKRSRKGASSAVNRARNLHIISI